MRVSIIVPAYNASATLGACLEGCLAQSHPDCEVIVVDDGSTDSTSDVAAQYAVPCFRQDNKGPAAARNLGASVASGDVIAFTDADCVPAPDWIARLLAGFTGSDVAAVGGTYTNANPQHRLSRLIHAEIQFRHGKFASDVDFLGSFNFAVRRNAFEAVGGFDPSFRAASAEDNDLSYRLAEYGRLLFTPDAGVAHYHPTKLRPYLNTQRRHGMWRVKLYVKHRDRVARGDQYASMRDLLKPDLAGAILVMFLTAIGGVTSGALSLQSFFAILAVAILSLLIYIWLSWQTIAGIMSRFPENRAFAITANLVYAGSVFFLRDFARQIGLIQGVWQFIIRGKRGGTTEWLAHS